MLTLTNLIKNDCTVIFCFFFHIIQRVRCRFETQASETGEEVKHERWSESSFHHPEHLQSWERRGCFMKLIFQLSLIISDYEGELDIWLTNNQSLSDVCIYLPSKGDSFFSPSRWHIVLKEGEWLSSFIAYHTKILTYPPHFLFPALSLSYSICERAMKIQVSVYFVTKKQWFSNQSVHKQVPGCTFYFWRPCTRTRV